MTVAGSATLGQQPPLQATACHGVLAVEAFWGLWLGPFGLLVRRSRPLPRVVGAPLVVPGATYVAHSHATLLLGGPRFLPFERVTMLARAAGELPVMLSLLLVGARARAATSETA